MNKFNFPEKGHFRSVLIRIENRCIEVYEQAFESLGIVDISDNVNGPGYGNTRPITLREVIEANKAVIAKRKKHLELENLYKWRIDKEYTQEEKRYLRKVVERMLFPKKRYRYNKPGIKFQTLTHTVDSPLKQSKKLLNKSK